MVADYITAFERLILLDEGAVARRYEIYRCVREAGPIFWSERLQRWYATHYADLIVHSISCCIRCRDALNRALLR